MMAVLLCLSCLSVAFVSLQSLTLEEIAVMISNTYSYGWLTGPGEFRLLYLCPGKIHDPICCFLFDADLDSTLDNNAGTPLPKYAALSYVWGVQDTPSESIWMVKHSMLRATYVPHYGDFEREIAHSFFG